MKTKERLQTTLDRLPYGPEGMPEDQKVSKKLPEGVRSRELYEDIVRIAGPSFVELLLTQLTSMVDPMMVGHGRDGESGNGDPGTGGRGIDHPA